MPRRRPLLLVLSALTVGLIAALISGESGAQGMTQSARTLGLAGAFTASASGNGALYTNPAGVGATLTYAMEGQYLYQEGLNTFNASVIDSKINPFLAMGAAYSYEDSTGDGTLSGHDARLVLASQIVPKLLVLGLGGRYLRFDEGDTRVLDGFTLDAGALVRATDGFFIGLSGNNLLDVCGEEGPCMEAGARRAVSGGLAFGSSFGLQVTGEARANLPDADHVTWEYAGGLEFLAAQLLALRGGYRWLDGPGESVVAAGLGLRSPSAGIDLAYTHNIDSGEYRFSVGLQLYFLTNSDPIRYSQR